LGEDLSPVSGFERELRETSFCAGLRGLNYEKPESGIEEAAKKVEALIIGELERLEKEGIPKEEIEAAILGMEFSNREIRRSGGPFSLVWMSRSLRAWLHGGTPWDSLLFVSPFPGLKKRIEADSRFFEKMIRRYFLDNTHRAFIIIEPQESFLEEKEAALAARLEKIEKSLGSAEKEAVIAKAAELQKAQDKKDLPEALAAIPHLSRSDLSPEIETVKREYLDVSGAPALFHPVFTNGISYVDLAFPLDLFLPEDYLWFPFFSRAVVSMGLPGMDYGEVSSLLARTAGGFYAMLHSGTQVPGAKREEKLPAGNLDLRSRDWIIFRLKALDEKIGASLELALRLITEADFSDLRRIRDLVLEMKNDLDSSLAPAGHIFASGFSSRLFSRSRIIDELWCGLDQIFFVHKLSNLDVSEISAKLKSIQAALSGGGVLVNLTSGSSGPAEGEIGRLFGSFGPPLARKNAPENSGSFSSLSEIKASDDKANVFSSSSLQVGFAAMSLKASSFGSPHQAAELVFSHLLSTGALWEDIRMKGGAYGAFARADHLESLFSFSTYRDPNPLRSLDAFNSIIKNQNGGSLRSGGREDVDKAVIGTYARETHPHTPAEKGLADLLRFLSGIEDSHRSERLKGIIALSESEVDAVPKRLAAETGFSHPVIIAGNSEAEKAASQLGVEIKSLPA
jgi:Zn-dependent M16 (insulinase) family peptidase